MLFLLIAWNVSARGALAALDTRLADWLHAHATAPLTAVMLAVTHLNSTFAIGVWSALFAGFAILLLSFGFNLLGDALRDTLDPRLRGQP